mgnify:CR=1 FL=1
MSNAARDPHADPPRSDASSAATPRSAPSKEPTTTGAPGTRRRRIRGGSTLRRIVAVVGGALVLGTIGLALGPIIGMYVTDDPANPEAGFVGFIWGTRIGPVVGAAVGIAIGLLISGRRDTTHL